MSKRMKALWVIGLLALSLAACTTARAASQPEPQGVPTSASQQPARTITVVGLGRVSLVPDIARINVGAEARASTVSEAKAEVDRQIAAIVAALREMGVAQEDIQTSHYSIHYERDPMLPTVREGPMQEAQGGYRVSSMLRVTVRDVEEAGDVLDAVVDAGANQVYGVTFTVSDDGRWQSEAREEAMADAVARAQELARLANVELGEVLSVSEGFGSAQVPMPMMAAERAMGGGIAPGELELGTQVQVIFAIQ
jgi:uncharacterized protein YggE